MAWIAAGIIVFVTLWGNQIIYFIFGQAFKEAAITIRIYIWTSI
jgi:O-antigen/teichoic acid export membrane protein